MKNISMEFFKQWYYLFRGICIFNQEIMHENIPKVWQNLKHFFAKTFHQASNSYFWRMEKCVDDPNYLILVKRLRMNQNLLKYLIMLWNEAPRDGRHTQGSSQRDNYNNWLSNAGCKHKQPCQMTSEIVFRHYFFFFLVLKMAQKYNFHPIVLFIYGYYVYT